MSGSKFIGTGTAIVTPFRKDDSVDFKSFEKLINHQLNGKIDYLVVLGTTGESVTLSMDEKEAVVNFAADVIERRIPLVVGIGGNNTREVINAIRHTDFENIDAILSVAPYYNKPSQKGLLEHFKTIASVSPAPVIIYNVPGRTSVNISADTTLQLAHEANNNFAGIKEASGNLTQVMKIIRDKPDDFHVISGDDSLAFPMVCMGGSGVISVIANALPAKFSGMVRNALNGDFRDASKIHFSLLELFEYLFLEGNPAGIKAALSSMGLIQNHLRLPLVPVSRSTYARIAELISS